MPDVTRIIGVKAERPRQDIRAGAPVARRAADTDYDMHILAAARAHRIDPLFLHAIIGTESAYRAAAVSQAGARGLMQIMPDTGAQFGVAGDALFDPAVNIDTGARLLKSLQRRYGGKVDLILAAYNAGAGAVARHGNHVPPFRETRNYVAAVMGRYTALRALPAD